ncbi:MAG: hypothetical protein CMJ83_15970 [Planctomycetes bacterium]|nr:hypothetical protein [Planctomycetota bacterium]
MVDDRGAQIGLTHEIVERINAGDTGAWNDLWSRVHDGLLFAVRCRLGPALRRHLESEDILQSVALEALRDLPGFVPRGADGLRHFLHVLVTRKIRDRVDTFGAAKRQGTERLGEREIAAAGSTAGYRDPDLYAPLERAIDALPEEMREVILLHRIDGLPSKEVADRMGRSDVAVRKLYSRALRLLRPSLPESSS